MVLGAAARGVHGRVLAQDEGTGGAARDDVGVQPALQGEPVRVREQARRSDDLELGHVPSVRRFLDAVQQLISTLRGGREAGLWNRRTMAQFGAASLWYSAL